MARTETLAEMEAKITPEATGPLETAERAMTDARERARAVYQAAWNAGFTYGDAERAFQAVLATAQSEFANAVRAYNVAIGAMDSDGAWL